MIHTFFQGSLHPNNRKTTEIRCKKTRNAESSRLTRNRLLFRAGAQRDYAMENGAIEVTVEVPSRAA